ncbi:MAG: FAD:protein FMN transferase [Flavobacteriaceae bacterium]|jgi:thiamine biosynthesis lipoprotein|nr:FAD:protein FMN transferase [Cryomorphaceae bacterium]MBL6677269.1 FAD:protein FMN transferase [Flavobacteriaceae bacterium]MDA1225457.1 FAD:protein FMN transferase [Bacteroidota bacterium]
MKSKILLILTLTLLNSCNTNTNLYKSIRGNALGTTYSVIVETKSNEGFIEDQIDSIFNQVNLSMSTYIDSSIITRVNKSSKPVEVDTNFINVFNKSKEIWLNSNGFFDPTAGSFVNFYGLGPETSSQQINDYKIDSLKNIVGFGKVTLNNNNEIVKLNKDIFLDFNAIAKGYSVDLINDLFIKSGYENFLIEVGGEVIAKGISNKGNRWKVAIQNPLEMNKFYSEIYLDNKSLATSGNYRKFRIDPITGDRYTHIINPITGKSTSNNILSASVISDLCITADGWATALMLMDPDQSIDIINNIENLESLILVSKDERIVPIKSNGWDLITK